MCLAMPAEVLEILPETQEAVVNLGGARKTVSVALLDTVEPGDYVIVHVGYALNRIDPDEARKTLALFEEGQREIRG
ncbi:MAG: HypC/HybG/HupF family hydrogenase formation chaperone [Gammaproteobacteria bacterium]|nr:MAG: HypC/HybG/HupF family hydrogenase formation chaperone [Gammaproteobacteria bacterium]